MKITSTPIGDYPSKIKHCNYVKLKQNSIKEIPLYDSNGVECAIFNRETMDIFVNYTKYEIVSAIIGPTLLTMKRTDGRTIEADICSIPGEYTWSIEGHPIAERSDAEHRHHFEMLDEGKRMYFLPEPTMISDCRKMLDSSSPECLSWNWITYVG